MNAPNISKEDGGATSLREHNWTHSFMKSHSIYSLKLWIQKTCFEYQKNAKVSSFYYLCVEYFSQFDSELYTKLTAVLNQMRIGKNIGTKDDRMNFLR